MAVLSVELGVEFALQSDVAVGLLVVFYIADGSAGQASVRVLTGFFALHYHSALVGVFIKERKFFEFQQEFVIYKTAYPKMALVAFAATDDIFIIVFGGFVFIELCKAVGKSERFIFPCLFFFLAFSFALRVGALLHVLELGLSYGAVHKYAVHRQGHSQESAIAGQD